MRASIPLCLLVLLAAAPAGAQGPATELKTGAAAFGDWHDDAPGVRRLIRPQDMPPPYATANSATVPGVVRGAPGARPDVPDGFSVSLWASGLDMPRVIRTAPGTGDVFLAESGSGRVLLYHPAPDGSAGRAAVFAEGLDRPFGIAFWPPGAPRYVYVAETNRVRRYPWTPGQDHPDGPAETIIPHLSTGGHWTRDLAFSPDGRRLFVSIGSQENVATDLDHPPANWEATHAPGAAWGREAGRADVLSYDPDGGNAATVATGLRNCSGLAVQPGTGALWCVTNERDGLGDNLPPDYATRVQQGGFYGWPWFYIGAHPDPRVHDAPAALAARVTLPDVLIQAHSAPLGIAFAPPEDTAFPAAYRGDAFVALHGSWNRARRTGTKVVRLRLHDGVPTGEVDDFLAGFVSDASHVWGRPVGVAFAPDGALLVTEDGNGTIWRVAATGAEASGPGAIGAVVR
jgi:glucose/arabinose dehydrogenase